MPDRQWITPNGIVAFEDGTNTYLLPTGEVVSENQPAGGGGPTTTLSQIERHYPRSLTRGLSRGLA